MHTTTLKAALLSSIAIISVSCKDRNIPAPEYFQEEGIRVQIENKGIYSSRKNTVLKAVYEAEKDTTVALNAVLLRDLSLMGEKDTVATACAEARSNETVKLNFGKLEPGFYQVNICGAEPFNIGVDPEKIVSPTTKQPDFDEFWAHNLAELAAIPMEASLELIPDRCTEKRNVYRVEMKSLGGTTIGGILAEPVAEGKYPAYIEYMGYGAEPYVYHGDDKPEAIQFLVSIREQGILKTIPNGENGRWIDVGLGDKEDFYYKGAFCDAVRAVDFVASREKTDASLIFGLGESQGGALTWIAASLDHRFRAIAPAVPFLSDYEDYAKIVWWPMWEVFETADKEGIAREDLFTTLSYFDVKNFTDRIACPVRMAFGLQDPTCPPHTNFAGFNNVKTDKDYMCVPRCGHGMWQIQEWADYRNEWFNKIQSEL